MPSRVVAPAKTIPSNHRKAPSDPNDPRFPRPVWQKAVRWLLQRPWWLASIIYFPAVFYNLCALIFEHGFGILLVPAKFLQALVLDQVLPPLFKEHPWEVGASALAVVVLLVGLGYLASKDQEREHRVLELRTEQEAQLKIEETLRAVAAETAKDTAHQAARAIGATTAQAIIQRVDERLAHIPIAQPPPLWTPQGPSDKRITQDEWIAQGQISHWLRDHTKYIEAVSPLPDHPEILVILRENGIDLIVHPMPRTREYLQVRTFMVQEWLDRRQLVVPMWWDERGHQVYWADLLPYLVRTGGVIAHESLDFERAIQRLNSENPSSIEAFFRSIMAWAKAWLDLTKQAATYWARNKAFPLTLREVIRDPGLLTILPISIRLIDALEEAIEGDSEQVIPHILEAGKRAAISSPERGIQYLEQVYPLVATDQELRNRLLEEFVPWAEQITTEQKVGVVRSLRALTQLRSLLNYQHRGDITFPAFTSTHTFPLGRLVMLLPADLLGESLLSILEQETNPDVLLHAAYYLGILNHRQHGDLPKRVREIRRRIYARRAAIKERWQVVDRQLLFCEVQLGGEEAEAEYLKRLKDQEAWRFEVPFLFTYYDRNRSMLERIADHRLEEHRPTDKFVRRIFKEIYESTRKRMRDTPAMPRLDPRLWLGPKILP